MLGILLIYIIGKRFYDLAVDFSKNKWLYAILGVITFYAAGNIFVLILAILDLFVFEWGFDWDSSFGINLLAIPIGLLGVWGLYNLLENYWAKPAVTIKDEIQDIGKRMEDS